MNKVFIPKESDTSETRIAGTPNSVKKLTALGLEVRIERGLGEHLGWSDEEYLSSGALLEDKSLRGLTNANYILKVNAPHLKEIFAIKPQSWSISFVDPFFQKETILNMQEKNINVISMERMPRTTVAQKMDALSSQNNLDGYASIILAAQTSPNIFPMMTTAAGTIFPVKILILGVGIAGLQAIATAKRLGAQVEAYDPRPTVAEQVQSLGAKFITLESQQTKETSSGYAQKQTSEQLKQQQKSLASILDRFDIVVTAAKVFGSFPPILLTKEMLSCMKKKALVIDIASKTGGNVEGSVFGESVSVEGVTVVGYSHSIHSFPKPASELYSTNLYHLMDHLWDKENKIFKEKECQDFLSKITPKIIEGDILKNDQ